MDPMRKLTRAEGSEQLDRGAIRRCIMMMEPVIKAIDLRSNLVIRQPRSIRKKLNKSQRALYHTEESHML